MLINLGKKDIIRNYLRILTYAHTYSEIEVYISATYGGRNGIILLAVAKNKLEFIQNRDYFHKSFINGLFRTEEGIWSLSEDKSIKFIKFK